MILLSLLFLSFLMCLLLVALTKIGGSVENPFSEQIAGRANGPANNGRLHSGSKTGIGSLDPERVGVGAILLPEAKRYALRLVNPVRASASVSGVIAHRQSQSSRANAAAGQPRKRVTAGETAPISTSLHSTADWSLKREIQSALEPRVKGLQ